MAILQPLHRLRRGVRRALAMAATPVRRRGYTRGFVVQPYRGYGSSTELFAKGRVFRQPRFGTRLDQTRVVSDVVDIARRVGRIGLSDVPLRAKCGEAVQYLTSDRNGYFRVQLPTPELATHGGWHTIDIVAEYRGEQVHDTVEVFVPPPAARFVVVSDIDDTVMHTGVANLAKMMYRLFVQGAESRVAFPGVAEFYRSLHRGASDDENNPMLYVSRGPWSIYEVLEEFFQMHDIPHGPILFLREWGLTVQRPLPKRATEHKKDLIEGMLARYPDMPFILIGDSGQHDPEVYANVVRDFPGRVAAVYIRDVTLSGPRDDEIRELAEEIAKQGSELVLTDDTEVMARHAAEHGYIEPAEVRMVSEDKAHDLAAEEDVSSDRAHQPSLNPA